MDTWTSQAVLVVKNPPANAGDIRDVGSIPGLGRFPGGGNGNPFQYSCLKIPMNRGAWWATVHLVAKSQTWLKWLSTHADSVLKSSDVTLLTKVHMVKAIFFPVVKSGRESRVIEEAKKSWFFWIVVIGCCNWIESPLGSKEIKPINPKGNQPWIVIGRTDAEAEAPILWPRDEKSWLIGKDPDAGKDWRQKKKGATEDEVVR